MKTVPGIRNSLRILARSLLMAALILLPTAAAASVATDIMGVSGRAMLDALIDGRDDPAVIAELAKGRMRSKIPELAEALTGRFTPHHAFLISMHLTLIDQYGQALGELDTRIAEAMEPFRAARGLLTSIPGFSTTIAEVVLAETGGDMGVFPTAGHLASWAGTAPGSHESAGRVKSTKTRPGNRYLEGASGPRRCRCPARRTPTSRPSTSGSRPAGVR